MNSAFVILFIVLALLALLAVVNAAFALIANWRNPPIGHFLECDGVRLHYVERGNPDAPAMVMLHGNGMMLQDFVISGLVDRAARNYRVLCFDRPGFGHSTRPRSKAWTPVTQAELLANVLARLGVRRPLVLAHSWGVMVAMALALRDPAEVRGLVLAAGYYFPSARTDVWLLSGPAIPIVGNMLRYTLAPIISWLTLPKLVRKLFAPRPVPNDFRREFPRALALRPSQLRAAAEEAALMMPSAARLARGYANLAVPVAIFAGDRDQVVRPEQALRLQQTLPRAVQHTVWGAGHMVHYAALDELLDAADLMADWPRVAA